ncbi:MAG: NAD-dependent epimerase/dehydratase family protein [Betaproteobacteria bacterium]|nr:NAD-dependent epimerase/dehydratase family protein [Betaproteobacteria bacterium]
MNVFVTGATGFIGGAVSCALLAAGHAVRGLVRAAHKADRLRAAGITPVSGSLDDRELLIAEARRADGVIQAASSDHRGAIAALLEGLDGSGKPLLHTSGSSVIGDDVGGNHLSAQIFDEETPLRVEPDKAARRAIDLLVLEAASRGVRSVVLCNSMIYGASAGLHAESVQIPLLVAQARETGVVRLVGSGVNRWSNVHIDDAVALYLLALAKAPAGAFYFVENGEASYAEIGAAIARRLGLGPVQSWTVDEAAAAWGRRAAQYTFGSNSRVRAVRARRELGWQPRHDSVVDWIERELPLG